MYAIENHLGRFEGETEKEAKAKLRKAKREYDKQQAQAAVDYKTAATRARAQAYNVMTHYLGSNRKVWEYPRGWRLFPIGGDHWGVRRITDSLGRPAWLIDCGEDGQAEASFHGAEPVEYVENGAGYCVALVFHSPEGERVWQAVGVCGGQLALAEILGVQADWFANVPPEGAAA